MLMVGAGLGSVVVVTGGVVVAGVVVDGVAAGGVVSEGSGVVPVLAPSLESTCWTTGRWAVSALESVAVCVGASVGEVG